MQLDKGLNDLNFYLQSPRSNKDNNDLRSDTTWLAIAEDTSNWDAMKSDFTGSRLKQPSRPTSLITTTTTVRPTTQDETTNIIKAYSKDEDGTNDDDEQDDDDALHVFFRLVVS